MKVGQTINVGYFSTVFSSTIINIKINGYNGHWCRSWNVSGGGRGGVNTEKWRRSHDRHLKHGPLKSALLHCTEMRSRSREEWLIPPGSWRRSACPPAAGRSRLWSSLRRPSQGPESQKAQRSGGIDGKFSSINWWRGKTRRQGKIPWTSSSWFYTRSLPGVRESWPRWSCCRSALWTPPRGGPCRRRRSCLRGCRRFCKRGRTCNTDRATSESHEAVTSSPLWVSVMIRTMIYFLNGYFKCLWLLATDNHRLCLFAAK